MKVTMKLGAAFTLGCLMLPSAQALETDGYFRTGLGASSGSDSQSCFQLEGALSKYRLGNECEQLAEIGMKQDFFQLDDGSRVGVYGMVQLFNDYDHAPTFQNEHGRTYLPQIYGYWNNLAVLNGGNLWAGRRYYKRNSIGMSDFFYWNQSATGGGLEDVLIGGLRYSYAFSRKDNFDQEEYINRHDFNVAGFQTNPNGELELGFSYVDKPEHIEGANSGWSVTAQHKQADFLGYGGSNTLALQYGPGPGTALGSTGDVMLDKDSKRYRLVEYFDMQFTSRFSSQFQVVYQKDQRPNEDDQNWLSVGVRPAYSFSDDFKLQGDLGYDQVEATGGTRRLTKFTIAPTWTPAAPGIWNRPEIRLFYTYARWNQAAQDAASEFDPGSALSDSGSFGSTRHGSTLGLQVEHGW